MHFLQSSLQLVFILQILCNANSERITKEKKKNGSIGVPPPVELPKPLNTVQHTVTLIKNNQRIKKSERTTNRPKMIDIALQISAKEGLDAMTKLYRTVEPDIFKNGQLLEHNHPAALLSKFSAPVEGTESSAMAAFATLSAAKAFKRNFKQASELGRQAHSQKISLRRTALEGLCPPRDPPICLPAAQRYRTHDGTCNNKRRPRWGSAQMPFNRFLPPEYGDGVDTIRASADGGAPLSSARFVSLLVHGAREGDAPLTLMIAQWGQLLDHDMTSTAQPRSINGSVPSCCGGKDFHPSCFPIKVPLDDPWLAPLKVRCLEFLRSAPAQRRDCILTWREQTNQATSYIDASPIYSSNAKISDNARTFRNGLLIFGRGNPANDECMQGAIAHHCIRSGDGRSGEQPGLLALHHVWVGEHNRIATELSALNSHWSDEKIYQETRRIIGALFQHITYREFLPIVLGREVCKLFDLDLLTSGYYGGYDGTVNPSVANSFSAAAFRFGHSLVQGSYMRCDRHFNIINNNVTLHEEFQRGDIGSIGSLHRLLRGLATQRALKRDEFITPELTNHLFQTQGFPFGLDLAAINIQRGRDHGIAPYTAWRQPCGLSAINTWEDFVNVVGPESARRIGHAYRSVHDIDLFVGGIAERPVVGGLIGPTFSCIIAQQFSNTRKGDRFWYENPGFESSYTPAQLNSIRRVSLAQILCRAVGGGTFQPHIFIPSDFPGNERLPCGIGALAPIDLAPWLEQDAFATPRPTLPPHHTVIAQPTVPENTFDIIPTNINPNSLSAIQVVKEDKGTNMLQSSNVTSVANIDFIPNALIGFRRPANLTKINDKLDFKRKRKTTTSRPTLKPLIGINNKLDKTPKPTSSIKKTRPPPVTNKRQKRPDTTTRRTVFINNVAIEFRSALQGSKKNKMTKSDRDVNSRSTVADIIPTKVTDEFRLQLTETKDQDKPQPTTNYDNDDEKISLSDKRIDDKPQQTTNYGNDDEKISLSDKRIQDKPQPTTKYGNDGEKISLSDKGIQDKHQPTTKYDNDDEKISLSDKRIQFEAVESIKRILTTEPMNVGREETKPDNKGSKTEVTNTSTKTLTNLTESAVVSVWQIMTNFTSLLTDLKSSIHDVTKIEPDSSYTMTNDETETISKFKLSTGIISNPDASEHTLEVKNLVHNKDELIELKFEALSNRSAEDPNVDDECFTENTQPINAGVLATQRDVYTVDLTTHEDQQIQLADLTTDNNNITTKRLSDWRSLITEQNNTWSNGTNKQNKDFTKISKNPTPEVSKKSKDLTNEERQHISIKIRPENIMTKLVDHNYNDRTVVKTVVKQSTTDAAVIDKTEMNTKNFTSDAPMWTKNNKPTAEPYKNISEIETLDEVQIETQSNYPKTDLRKTVVASSNFRENNKIKKSDRTERKDKETANNTKTLTETQEIIRQLQNYYTTTKSTPDDNQSEDLDIDPVRHSQTIKDHIRVPRDTDSDGFSRLNRKRNVSDKEIGLSNKTNHIELRNHSNYSTTTPRTTLRNVELRHYQAGPVYSHPQKVNVGGANSDQYEIEINIRQKNKAKPSLKPTDNNYFDLSTGYTSYGNDRYYGPRTTPTYVDYGNTAQTSTYSYYNLPVPTKVPAVFTQTHRTKPPTIIYINEHDDRTTTRAPNLLQNIFSFATNGFGGNKEIASSNKGMNSESSFVSIGGSSNTNAVFSVQNHQPLSEVRPGAQSASYSSIDQYLGDVSSHASSSAVSTGHFGSISGVASSHGSDSTFSFNIRPRPVTNQGVVEPPKPISEGAYGLLPPRRPPYNQQSTLSYASPPHPISTVTDLYFGQPNREDTQNPFSFSPNRQRPSPSPYYSRSSSNIHLPLQKEAANNDEVSIESKSRLDKMNNDIFEKSELIPNDTLPKEKDKFFGKTALPTNDTALEKETDSDELVDYDYDYGDEHENNKSDEPTRKFDRDGYLRPDHMAEALFKQTETKLYNKTGNNATILSDNFVLPVLNSFGTLTDVFISQTNTNSKETAATTFPTNFPDIIKKSIKNYIFAEDNNDQKLTSVLDPTALEKRRRPVIKLHVPFAPINVLTKPERTDNWLIFEPLDEKPLLPEQPEINTESLVAAEFPIPFTEIRKEVLTHLTTD